MKSDSIKNKSINQIAITITEMDKRGANEMLSSIYSDIENEKYREKLQYEVNKKYNELGEINNKISVLMNNLSGNSIFPSVGKYMRILSDIKDKETRDYINNRYILSRKEPIISIMKIIEAKRDLVEKIILPIIKISETLEEHKESMRTSMIIRRLTLKHTYNKDLDYAKEFIRNNIIYISDKYPDYYLLKGIDAAYGPLDEQNMSIFNLALLYLVKKFIK